MSLYDFVFSLYDLCTIYYLLLCFMIMYYVWCFLYVYEYLYALRLILYGMTLYIYICVKWLCMFVYDLYELVRLLMILYVFALCVYLLYLVSLILYSCVYFDYFVWFGMIEYVCMFCMWLVYDVWSFCMNVYDFVFSYIEWFCKIHKVLHTRTHSYRLIQSHIKSNKKKLTEITCDHTNPHKYHRQSYKIHKSYKVVHNHTQPYTNNSK